jgi:hypothetical protein
MSQKTNGGAKKKIRALRSKLWMQNPRCCYCGKLTVLPKTLELEPGDSCPPNMATLEHIYNQHHPMRDREMFDIACNECNGIKGLIEAGQMNKPIDLEEIREKTIKKLMIINKMIEFEKEQI